MGSPGQTPNGTPSSDLPQIVAAEYEQDFISSRRRAGLWFVAAVTVLLALWGMLRAWDLNDRLILDESQVLGQVNTFLDGRMELFRRPGAAYPAAAMLPGFQAVLAGVAALTGRSSPGALRFYCFGFSLAYAAVAYGIARQLTDASTAVLRAAQAYVLPIVFPFHCLMYTDVFSLLVNLSAFWACLRRSYLVAGALMLLAMFVRQTNVVFIIFLLGFSYFDKNNFACTRDRILNHMRSCWLLLAGMGAFVVFVLFHQRVALDDPWNQPIAFSPGNLLMSIVIIGVLFLPVFLVHAHDMIRWAFRHWRCTLVVILVAGFASLTYTPLHAWNRLDWQLRNQVLSLMLGSYPQRAGLMAMLSVSTMFILTGGLIRPVSAALYGFWFLSLAPIALVEPRYQFAPIVLYLLLRKPERFEVELFLWSYFVVGGAALEYVMTTTRYVV